MIRQIFFLCQLSLSILVILLFIIIQGCDEDTPTETNPTSSGSILFERSPIDYLHIRQMTPLGNINPPGHTFPTDHIYFYLQSGGLAPVFAHAPGTVHSIYYHDWSNDYKITFKHTETFFSYLDHVNHLVVGIEIGAEIATGDSIGMGDPAVSAVDLGVIDYDSTRFFVIPERYHDGTVHCGDPYQYFTEAIRESLLIRNPRTIEPRGGKIDFDKTGALSGNWFLEGTPIPHSSGIDYMENHLAFVYDMFDPTQIRIAAGGTLVLTPFVCSIVGNAPDPANVTLESGIIAYDLNTFTPNTLLVQLLDSLTIKVEVFPIANASAFTDGAKVYIR